MSADRPARSTTLLRAALAVIASLYLITFLVIAWLRVPYPFELEWMEGGALDHVRRILDGKRLYVAPSIEFVPYIYNPLYFYVSAGVAGLVGAGLPALRLVSLLSTLGTFLLIFRFIKRETGSGFAALLSSCLFAATFRISGAWFDLARVDALFLLLMLGALYVLRFYPTLSGGMLAGLLVALSFLTKQTALLISAPLMLSCLLRDKRHALAFIGTTVLLCGAAILALDTLHDGWYRYYIFDLPAQHVLETKMFLEFWTRDLLSPLGLAVALSILYLLERRSDDNSGAVRFYLLASMGMMGGAWSSRVHSGAYDNVVMPAYAMISLTFGLAIHLGLERLRAVSAATEEARRSDAAARWERYLYLVCLLQFLRLIYNPAAQVPTNADLEAGWKFVHAIERTPGEVLIPGNTSLASLAGKRTYAQSMAVIDVLRGQDPEKRAAFDQSMSQAIREKRFTAIVLEPNSWIQPEFVSQFYTLRGPVFREPVFWPVTGMKTRPEGLYVRKEE